MTNDNRLIDIETTLANREKTIDELIELSDKKMYENKRKIKEKR